jgi:hypothetical protein
MLTEERAPLRLAQRLAIGQQMALARTDDPGMHLVMFFGTKAFSQL